MASPFDTLLAACGQDFSNIVDQPAVEKQDPIQKPQHKLPKSCAQCGATKTPQWRKGPFGGEKKYCNACAVKWHRQLKGSSQNNRKKLNNKATLDASLPKYQDQPAMSAYNQLRRQDSSRSRGTRRAATRSSSRACDVEAEEEQTDVTRIAQQTDSAGRDTLSHSHRQPPANPSLLPEESPEHSDSAEEVVWAPGRQQAADFVTQKVSESVPPSPSPVSGIVGTEDAAALNLMSMSAFDRPPVADMAVLAQMYTPDAYLGAQTNIMDRSKSRDSCWSKEYLISIEFPSLADNGIAAKALRETMSQYPQWQDMQHMISCYQKYMPQVGQDQWLQAQAHMEYHLQTCAAAEAAVLAVAKAMPEILQIADNIEKVANTCILLQSVGSYLSTLRNFQLTEFNGKVLAYKQAEARDARQRANDTAQLIHPFFLQAQLLHQAHMGKEL